MDRSKRQPTAGAPPGQGRSLHEDHRRTGESNGRAVYRALRSHRQARRTAEDCSVRRVPGHHPAYPSKKNFRRSRFQESGLRNVARVRCAAVRLGARKTLEAIVLRKVGHGAIGMHVVVGKNSLVREVVVGKKVSCGRWSWGRTVSCGTWPWGRTVSCRRWPWGRTVSCGRWSWGRTVSCGRWSWEEQSRAGGGRGEEQSRAGGGRGKDSLVQEVAVGKNGLVLCQKTIVCSIRSCSHRRWVMGEKFSSMTRTFSERSRRGGERSVMGKQFSDAVHNGPSSSENEGSFCVQHMHSRSGGAWEGRG